jgi:hypothetical protein
MGECSDLLDTINETLLAGLTLKNGDEQIDLVTSQQVEDIITQTDKLTFETDDGKQYLLVKQLLEVSDIQIGAVELKDADSDTRADIETDSGKGAIYVQSQSLLSITEFDNLIGILSATPTQYTVNWRLLQLADLLDTIDGVLDSIQTQTDKFTFDSTSLIVKDTQLTFIPSTGELSTKDSQVTLDGTSILVKDSQFNFDSDDLTVKDTQLNFDTNDLLVKDSQFNFDSNDLTVKDTQLTFIPSTGELSTKDSQITLDGTSILVKDSQFNFDGDDLTVKVTPPTPTINTIVDETSVSYANNDSANTLKTITDLEVPTTLKEVYSVSIENASEETDLTVQLYIKEGFLDGETRDVRWAKLGDTFTVEKSPDNINPDQTNKISVAFEQVRGAYLANGLGISLYNNDAIGVSGAFDVRIIVREAGNDS